MWPEARGYRDTFRLCVERDWRLACQSGKSVRVPGLRSEEAWLSRRRTCPAGHGCVYRSRAGNRGQQTGGQRIVDLHISPLESYIQIWCTEDLNIILISS